MSDRRPAERGGAAHRATPRASVRQAPRPRGPGGGPASPTVRERVMREVLSRVREVSGLAFTDRNNPTKLENAEVPAAIVYDGEETPAAQVTGSTGLEQRFEVRVIAEAEEWGDVGGVCNGLIGLVELALRRDPQEWLDLGVGSLDWDGTSDLETAEDRGGRPRGEVTIGFVALRTQAEGDPFNL
jgi:hypothetical protein